MRSLRLSFHSVSLRYPNALYSSSKVPVKKPEHASAKSIIKETATASLLGMLWEHHLYPSHRHLLFRESFNRIPELHHSDIIKMLNLFIHSKVPTQICIKLTQVLMRRENLSQADLLEILQILFRKVDNIHPFGSIIRVTLDRIDDKQICTNFLYEMWPKSIDVFSMNQLYPVIWRLVLIMINRLREFSNEEIEKILKQYRSVKHTSCELLEAIHSDVISHRPKEFNIMRMVLKSYKIMLKFDTKINETYSQKIIECLRSGEVSPSVIGLAGVLAKINYIKPGLYRDLEPYAIQLLEDDKLSRAEINNYLSGCAIADYFPKKFIQNFAVPETLRDIMTKLVNIPFIHTGLDICIAINYARSKGTDLELSQEVQDIMEQFTFIFSKLSWQFQQSEVNPWENRASSSLADIFPLYGGWPTCNGYVVDACLFFDKEGNPMSLSKEADFLVCSDKTFQGYFNRFGLDNTKVRNKYIKFEHIWNLLKSPDILKGVHTKIAIEFNGPYHFLQVDNGSDKRIDGPTMLRRKFLQASGWEYIGIPSMIFDSVKSSQTFQIMMRNRIEHILRFK